MEAVAKGKIYIFPDGTITIKLDKGEHATRLYPNGIQTWLEVTVDQYRDVPTHELKRDGVVKFEGTYNKCWEQLLKSQSQSTDWAMKHEGWSIDPKEDK